MKEFFHPIAVRMDEWTDGESTLPVSSSLPPSTQTTALSYVPTTLLKSLLPKFHSPVSQNPRDTFQCLSVLIFMLHLKFKIPSALFVLNAHDMLLGYLIGTWFRTIATKIKV